MNNEKAFTLIEMMVVVVIGLIVTGAGLVSVNNFNEKQQVEAVRKELIANLRLARNYAITEQFNASVPANTDRVIVTIDSGGVVTAKSQKGTTTNANDQTFFSKDIVDDDVSISANNTIAFSVSDGRSISGNVSIGVSGIIVRTIIIQSSGVISESN